VSRKLLRACLLVVGALGSRAASALPLQEVTDFARGRVLHLSVRDDRGDEEGSGSGFIISGDGRVVTNHHVVRGARNLVAVFPNKREVEVTGTWAYDAKADLAIVQLAPGAYQPLTLGLEPAREGEDIIVIGSPLGLGNAVSTGIVSAVRERGIRNQHFTEEELESWTLQITAAAAPGSSGSPILRSNGEVIGVLVGHLHAFEGAFFGISVQVLRNLNASSSTELRPLNAATGVRSRRTNLIISGGLFASVVVAWVLVARLQRRDRRA
jgi:S1-C subfamily serine protease